MFRAGNTSAGASGATSISISFGATFASAPSTVVATMGNTSDASYLLVQPFLIHASTTGCQFEFNGAVDSANYFISWLATDESTITGVTGPTGASYVPAKPINRLPTVTSVADYDYTYITFQSTSGGIPVTYRMSLTALKSYLNS